MPRVLHVSDLHFGKPSVPVQVEALEQIIAAERFDAIVISGDLSQRSRKREFMRARAFIERAERRAPLLAIPGNHDVAWWMAPFGVGRQRAMYTRYRRYIREELEPVLLMPGLTIVGVNSSHGIQPYTLTTRPRDLSVVGAVRPAQWERARRIFAESPATDVKALVIHHNLLRGRLSNRWGLANRERGVDEAAATGADVVLCGHDHEARIEQLSAAGRRFVVSNANTLTDRRRGDLPAAFNVIECDPTAVRVAPWEWSEAARTFAPARTECFTR